MFRGSLAGRNLASMTVIFSPARFVYRKTSIPYTRSSVTYAYVSLRVPLPGSGYGPLAVLFVVDEIVQRTAGTSAILIVNIFLCPQGLEKYQNK